MSDLSALKANLWKLFLIRMFFWMHFFSAVLVPFFTDWGGLTLFQVLILNAWFMLWNFFLEVPTGTVADRWGRKVSLAAGSIVGMIAALIYVSRPDFKIFLLAEVVFATAYTLHSGADEALAYDSLVALKRTDEARKVMARMEAFKLGGIIIGALTGGFIAARWGLSTPLKVYALPACLAFLLSLTLKEPSLHPVGERRLSYGRILKEGGRYFLQHRVLLLLTLDVALTQAMAWGMVWLYQPLLERSGVPLAFFGLVHAASCAGQIAFLSQVDYLESLLGSKRRLLIWSCVISGTMFLILGMMNWMPAVVAGIILCFTFGMTRIPLFSSYMNHHIPSDKRATVLSFTSMIRTFSIVLINPIIGFLADWSLSVTLLVLGTSMILIAFFSRIEERHLLDRM